MFIFLLSTVLEDLWAGKGNLGFPSGSEVNNPPDNAEDVGSIPVLGRSPGERKWQLTPVFLPGKSHERRSLIGYSPWGRKESDTTEQIHFTSLHFSQYCNSSLVRDPDPEGPAKPLSDS